MTVCALLPWTRGRLPGCRRCTREGEGPAYRRRSRLREDVRWQIPGGWWASKTTADPVATARRSSRVEISERITAALSGRTGHCVQDVERHAAGDALPDHKELKKQDGSDPDPNHPDTLTEPGEIAGA
jgi:hypothetical protein